MRGKIDLQTAMFFAINLEERVRTDHPLRPIKRAVDAILREMVPLFEGAYSTIGRPSVPPERLLKASLLQCLYSVRSETQLVERLDTDLLFRWFCDMDPAEPVFDPTAFTHNRQRLEDSGIAATFFDWVVKRAIDAGLTSDEHFSVDGTLIESYASLKSFKPKDDDHDHPSDNNGFKSRNAEVDFHGKKRSNATHCSTTDGEARLYRKGNGQPALLYHMGHAITENRNGLIMAVAVTEASGTAEPAAAEDMVDELHDRFGIRIKTLGADKNYDSGPHLLQLEQRGVTPHVAMRSGPVGGEKQTTQRYRKNRAGIAARQRMAARLRDQAYAMSQRCRKLTEEGFGWLKTIAGLARTRLVGRWKIRQQMHLAAATFNLVRMRKLLPA